MKNNFTKSFQKGQVESKWFLIDATDMVAGRMAAEIANLLRGKNKAHFTPNSDCGDNVIVINADKVALTGKKMSDKVYYRHTGHPGGLKETTPEKLIAGGKSDRIIEKAVERMLPDNKLRAVFMKKLHVYCGETHNHEAQKPEVLDLSKANSKNKRG
ncbi:MAG: 50S ribosomal protein L13 [Alphaproteobacteria bacterium]|jgi:large subunit ribosomal protein L13|nr:50S ribosomal protein L13 [Alphaproteobacteria bacterium]